jgi:hypothetical protein
VGCGCGAGAGPAALSLPAAALCWAVFGPAVALARFGAAVVLHFATRLPAAAGHEESDPLATLSAIAKPAFALGLATALAQSGHRGHFPVSLPGPAVAMFEGIAGFVAGTFAPCTTAAVALAGMLRGIAPFAAAGILVAAGLVPPPNFRRSHGTRPHDARGSRPHDARLGLAIVALGCATLAARHGGGFVHPRLVPFLWLAVPGALLVARSRGGTELRLGACVPALMLAALVGGSPIPGPGAAAGAPDDLYPGEAIAFTGTTATIRGRTVLVRYAITCCRADASALVLPTNLRLRLAANTWVAIRGTVARDDAGLFVRATEWKHVAPPADPYLYR